MGLLVLSLNIFNKYFDKAFGLKNAGLNVGGWASGIDRIYSLNVEKIDFNYFTKLFYVLSKICGLALYPFYSNQDTASLFIFSILILGFIVNSIRYRSKLTPITIFVLSTFLINIYYSTSSAYILAPTRHSIFLFPFFIYGIFITFFSLINNFKLKKSTFTFTSILLCTSLFSTFYFGTNNAISQLKYDKKEYSKLIKMAKNADFYAPNLHTYHKRTADPFSNILLHDDQAFRALHPKYCSSNNETTLSKYKLFLYSHRQPIIFEGKDSMRKNMINGCFPLTAEYKILSKIEVKGYRDIEHDNNVGNGGSGLYGYLVEIIK